LALLSGGEETEIVGADCGSEAAGDFGLIEDAPDMSGIV
jgi:hypothetical protein